VARRARCLGLRIGRTRSTTATSKVPRRRNSSSSCWEIATSLDFLRATLTVAEQITQGPRGVTTVGAPKSAAGRRTLAVPAELMERLAAHLRRRGLTGANPTAFVFA
jgi:hypothetical protein